MVGPGIASLYRVECTAAQILSPLGERVRVRGHRFHSHPDLRLLRSLDRVGPLPSSNCLVCRDTDPVQDGWTTRPCRVVLNHYVEDDEQLMHAGSEGHLLLLAIG